ncbi:MAG TPA: hypothetical protein VIF15_01520 [Polyangiaceae bacterium]|jgi:hypothetical protein
MNPQSGEVVPPRARCWRCGVEHGAAAWATLEVVERVAPADVQRLVLNWPKDLGIEVRVCVPCGARIARKLRAGR